MTIFLLILCLLLGLTVAVLFFLNKKILGELDLAKTERDRAHSDAAKSLDEAQALIDKQQEEMRAEGDRYREHCESEARRITESIQKELSDAHAQLADLRRYAGLRDAEAEIKRSLDEAVIEANALRSQAQKLLTDATLAAERERLKATEGAKIIYDQADARLNQAMRDAGKIIGAAEAKAKEIAGDAFESLKDKQLLEKASQAIRNIIDGYGDKYIIPTHSLLDDLAAEFGYTSAGESLKSARELSRRMVEQGEAAACDYAETNRKETAIRFVIDAFNGRVDAILSRIKRENHGQLEQEIRDAFSLVNLNGQAFRNARILESFLNARIEELKWGAVVHELARRQQEEQRELKARIRDEEKAKREYEKQIRQAEREEELKRQAIEEKERELADIRKALENAAAKDKAELEQRLLSMQQANDSLKLDLAAATEKKLTIAQQTKTGTVYIVSNVGAFGEGIYKIGQTRRPDPQDRIDELGDASVPFDFDVHAWIKSDNAPALEHRLQRRFLKMQINKVNSRKEFFKVSLKDIREEVDRLSKDEPMTIANWTETAKALEYRESLDIESDPQKLSKWLERQEALTDRALRLDSLRISEGELSVLEAGDRVD